MTLRERALRLRYNYIPDHLIGEILTKRWTDNAIPFLALVVTVAAFGTAIPGFFKPSSLSDSTRQLGEFSIVVTGLTIVMGNLVRNTSFSVYDGQITGVFGLIGSGRTETFKIVSGIYKRDFLRGGDVELRGRNVRYRVPAPAVKDGIVYVTEDRKTEGFFETMQLRLGPGDSRLPGC